MSIKPVDFQIILPKTVEVAKISTDQAQRNLMAQKQQAEATLQRAEDSLKQVYSRAQPQNVVISDKQEKNRQQHTKKEKRKNSSSDMEGRSGMGSEGRHDRGFKTSTIDIKI